MHEANAVEGRVLRVWPLGYRYWAVKRGAYGWREVGGEAFGVVDDFGNLVFVREVMR